MNNKNKLKLLKFKLKNKQLGADIFGAYKSAFHGTGMEFAEHREYIPGDEIKHIDWKVSARSNKIYVKRYDEERNLNVLFVISVNFSFFYFPEKMKILEETFFILGSSALHNNDNIVALVNDKFFYQSKSIHTLPKIIEEFHNPKNKEYLNSKIEDQLEKIKHIKNHLIFILTDDTNINPKSLKKIELNNNEIVYINIFDYFENNLDTFGKSFDFRNGEKILTINLSNTQKIEKFRALRRGNIYSLEEQLKKIQLGYVYLDTTLDPFKELLQFFLHRNYK